MPITDPKEKGKMPFKDEEIDKITNTPRFEEGQRMMAESIKKGGGDFSGFTVKGNVATAKPYEKKYTAGSNEKGKQSGSVVTDGSGKTISKVNSGAQNKNLQIKQRQDYVKDSTDTMKRRQYNANFYNVNSGAKKDLSQSDKRTLVSLRKATIDKTT